MRNIISFLFSLDFSVQCDLDMVRLIHMADTQSCRNRVFCYICLLCLCSSAHLYRRTPSIPACPQHALSPPQDTLMVPCLSLFSLFPLPIPCSISLWHNMGQLSDRARDLSVLLTLSLFKSKWNAQTILPARVTYSIYKWNRIFNETRNIYYESWFHEYWNEVCQLVYAAAHIDLLICKNDSSLMLCFSVSSVIKRPTPCLSVRAVRHSAGLWNLLSAALMEVQIHVHTHNISHMLWHCRCVTLASLLTGKHYRNEP